MNSNLIYKTILSLLFVISFSTKPINLNPTSLILKVTGISNKIETLKNGIYSGLAGLKAAALPMVICVGISKQTDNQALITTVGASLWLANLYAMKKLLGNKSNDFVLVGSSLITMYFIGKEIEKRKNNEE